MPSKSQKICFTWRRASCIAIGRSAGDIGYVELVNRGKAAAAANLPLVIGCALALVAGYVLLSKLVMGRNARKG